MVKGFHQIPREKSQAHFLHPVSAKVYNPICRFEQEIIKFKISDFESIFNVKGDIVAEGEIIVNTKEMLDRSRRRTVPQTSRT